GVRIAHPPGRRRLLPPVAAARRRAAEPSDRLPERDRRRARVRPGEPRDVLAPEEQRHRERAAEEPAVKHEAAAGDEEGPRRAYELGPGVEHDPEARAQQAADRPPYHGRRRAGGRRHREALDEHLAATHGEVPAEERQRRTLERERRGQLVAPYLPLGSK